MDANVFHSEMALFSRLFSGLYSVKYLYTVNAHLTLAFEFAVENTACKGDPQNSRFLVKMRVRTKEWKADFFVFYINQSWCNVS